MEHMNPDEEARSIAARVDLMREAAGLSVRSLAEQANIPPTTLTRRLIGASPLTVAELASIAGVLGTTVPTLAGAPDTSRSAA